MQEIFINGEPRSFPEDSTIWAILNALGITEKTMALAINGQVVKQAEWEHFIPQAGDRIECLHFVGGG